MRSVFSFFSGLYKPTNNHQIISYTHNLYIKQSPIHGRGVFAQKHFRQGATIEICPILEIPLSYLHNNSELIINYYAFLLDKEKDKAMLLLGYGSLYNHQAPSNATCDFEDVKGVMRISAVREIERNEEITINYHGPFDSQEPIDFWKNHE